MGVWVLWHQTKDGVAFVERVYTQETRAKEDFDRIESFGWKLDEVPLFTGPSGSSTVK